MTPDEGASYLGCYSESHGSGCGGGVMEDEELSLLLCKLTTDRANGWIGGDRNYHGLQQRGCPRTRRRRRSESARCRAEWSLPRAVYGSLCEQREIFCSIAWAVTHLCDSLHDVIVDLVTQIFWRADKESMKTCSTIINLQSLVVSFGC